MFLRAWRRSDSIIASVSRCNFLCFLPVGGGPLAATSFAFRPRTGPPNLPQIGPVDPRRVGPPDRPVGADRPAPGVRARQPRLVAGRPRGARPGVGREEPPGGG